MRTAEQLLTDRFPNATELDWFKPVLEAMKLYAQQAAVMQRVECARKYLDDYEKILNAPLIELI